VKPYLTAGVPVGLGCDGSASNDGSHMLAEARQALLLARVLGDPGALTARQALELGTLGGARVLGRDDIGALAVGKCADFLAVNLNRFGYAGALHDPVAAVIFCAPQAADFTVIHGRVVVRDGHLTTLDLGRVIERHNQIAHQMLTA
jgi:cytosine/adenosine deaminase-related metal-dependent hydrolase